MIWKITLAIRTNGPYSVCAVVMLCVTFYVICLLFLDSVYAQPCVVECSDQTYVKYVGQLCNNTQTTCAVMQFLLLAQ